jgi:hypothetical protein
VAFVLPLVKASGHRDHVLVSEILKGLGGEGAACAAGAVDGDRSVLIGEATLNGELKLTARDVDRAWKGALLVFVGFTHVENRQVIEIRRNLVGGYLTDLGLRGVQ